MLPKCLTCGKWHEAVVCPENAELKAKVTALEGTVATLRAELAKYDDADMHIRNAFGFEVAEWRDMGDEQRTHFRNVFADHQHYNNIAKRY